MDSFAVKAYLADLERARLQVEDRLIHLPETSYILTQFEYGLSVNIRDYLHAIPIVSSLIRSLVYSPRMWRQGIKWALETDHAKNNFVNQARLNGFSDCKSLKGLINL